MEEIDDVYKKVGEQIVFLRKRQGLSQIQLSTMLDIEDSALRRIEKGRTNPTLKTLYSISKCLNVPLSELVDI